MDILGVNSPEFMLCDGNAFPNMIVLAGVDGLIQKIEVLELAQWGEGADTCYGLIRIQLG
jgi:hypothetical protein